MPNFVISTQYLENYGAHTEPSEGSTGSGSFEASGFYWKFKGGDDYLVKGFDRIQDAVAYIAEKYCAVADTGGKEFPSQWRTESEWYEKLGGVSEEYKEFLLDTIHIVEYKDV